MINKKVIILMSMGIMLIGSMLVLSACDKKISAVRDWSALSWFFVQWDSMTTNQVNYRSIYDQGDFDSEGRMTILIETDSFSLAQLRLVSTYSNQSFDKFHKRWNDNIFSIPLEAGRPVYQGVQTAIAELSYAILDTLDERNIQASTPSVFVVVCVVKNLLSLRDGDVIVSELIIHKKATSTEQEMRDLLDKHSSDLSSFLDADKCFIIAQSIHK